MMQMRRGGGTPSWHWKDPGLRGLKLAAPPPTSGKGIGRWGRALQMKLHKTQTRVGECIHVPESDTSHFSGHRSFCTWDAFRPHYVLLHLAAHLCPLCYLYHKLVNLRQGSAEVCELLQQIKCRNGQGKLFTQ